MTKQELLYAMEEEVIGCPKDSPLFREKVKTVENELASQGYNLHHCATGFGYIPKYIVYGVAEYYHGRYGTGLKVKRHNPKSSNCMLVEYWVK